ncbi:hypothetical protein [Paracoccus lutimaris]|jgi:hypothetical protein|uniref:hypothetical protein n=1 Tax=Paracoccus lutimaris TaxID=1490030 RepID=UPI0011C0640C|nr:hypothetical protein [Paracoccus lutimaris]
MITDLAQKARKQGCSLWMAGANPAVQRAFLLRGLCAPLCRHASTVEKAITRQLATGSTASGLDHG